MFTNLYSNRNSLLTLIIFIAIILNIRAAAINKDNFCYAPHFLNSSWTDRRPEFVVNMTFNEQGSIRSLTWVNKEITSPIMKLQILQKDSHSHKLSTLYNVTTRLCELYQFVNKISMFQQAFQTALKQGNYSMDCPMKVGFYVMDNARVGLRNPLLGFLHRPKTLYTIIGGLFEELENKSLVALTTYNFTFKIVKRSCRDN